MLVALNRFFLLEPILHLLVQIQLWKHKNNVWNRDVILVSLLLTLNRFNTLFSIVDFQQVNPNQKCANEADL